MASRAVRYGRRPLPPTPSREGRGRRFSPCLGLSVLRLVLQCLGQALRIDLDLHARPFQLAAASSSVNRARPSRGSAPRPDRPTPGWPAASARSARVRAPSPATRPCAPAAARMPAARTCSAGTDRSASRTRRAGRSRPAHRLPDRQRLDARLHAHAEHLRRGRGRDVAEAVVHQLGDRSGADRSDVARRVADHVEHRLPLARTRPRRRRTRSPACRSPRRVARR